MLIKLSIGFFLLRLATQKAYVWILRVSLVIIVLWSMVTFLWDIFQCNPVAKQWDYRIETGHCVTPDQVVQAAYAFSVMCVLSDWLFVCSDLGGGAVMHEYVTDVERRLFYQSLCYGR